MATTVNGSAGNGQPDFDVSFRYQDAAFLALSEVARSAAVYDAAHSILQYLNGSTGDDPDGLDEVFPVPDLKGQAYTTSVAYNSPFTGLGPHFAFSVRFVPDPTQSTGISTGQVKARINTAVGVVIDEIAAIELAKGLPVDAVIDWL